MKNKVKGISLEIETDPEFEQTLFNYLDKILKILNRIDAKTPPVALAHSIIFNNDYGQRIKTMLLKADSAPAHLNVKAVDSKGNDASVEGQFIWASSDETIATVMADEGGAGATVTATGALGECLITAKADADLGEGVKEIIGTMPVVVVAGEAVEVRITEG